MSAFSLADSKGSPSLKRKLYKFLFCQDTWQLVAKILFSFHLIFAFQTLLFSLFERGKQQPISNKASLDSRRNITQHNPNHKYTEREQGRERKRERSCMESSYSGSRGSDQKPNTNQRTLTTRQA